MLITGWDKRGSSVSRTRGTKGASIIRLPLFSSAECHVRDKIQTIPTNKGSLEGRRGWNIFEEWYCLTPPPPSPSLSLPLPPFFTPLGPQALSSRGSGVGKGKQRWAHDKGWKKKIIIIITRVSVMWDCARDLLVMRFFFFPYNEVKISRLKSGAVTNVSGDLTSSSCCLTPTSRIEVFRFIRVYNKFETEIEDFFFHLSKCF